MNDTENDDQPDGRKFRIPLALGVVLYRRRRQGRCGTNGIRNA